LEPVLRERVEAYGHPSTLPPEIPLSMHSRYLDVELSVAFDAVAKKTGRYRNFYTGVEPVGEGRYDLLLVTLDKSGVAEEHLAYKDFPISEKLFHWQSKADTTQESDNGRRHLQPERCGVTPLLFVRETKKDSRAVTSAFLYLGPVKPETVRGERPISIEWALATPAPTAFVRGWTNVG
jgi:hypothetical protein